MHKQYPEIAVDVCPHTWLNGLAAVTSAHLVASLPNPRVQEICMIQGPLQRDILAEKPAIEDGWRFQISRQLA